MDKRMLSLPLLYLLNIFSAKALPLNSPLLRSYDYISMFLRHANPFLPGAD